LGWRLEFFQDSIKYRFLTATRVKNGKNRVFIRFLNVLTLLSLVLAIFIQKVGQLFEKVRQIFEEVVLRWFAKSHQGLKIPLERELQTFFRLLRILNLFFGGGEKVHGGIGLVKNKSPPGINVKIDTKHI